MPPELEALIAGSRDAVRRVIVDLREKADAAEQLRSAEHRAFMAEQREMLAALTRQVAEKIAAVRDGVDGKDGKDGADGAPGPEGAAGPAGDVGPQGERGDQGEQGRAGQDGSEGAQGPQGDQGSIGEAGTQGERGEQGDIGPQGEQGLRGDAGERGEAGATGEVGPAGRDGTDAYAGEARGLFDPDATYRAMDVVSFNGCEWRAKRNDPGDLPGDGWMLSASRGKRGDRGERGLEGSRGKDGSSVVAAYVDTNALRLTLTRDDGAEVAADLYELAEVIRDAGRG